MGKRTGPKDVAFWSRVNQGDQSSCWLWTRATDRDGYGVMEWYDGKQKRASRIAFFLTHGYWPEVVMHSCDNPPCCNPSHLLAGTQQTNSADRVAKGRSAMGPRSPHTKLNADQVRDIRSRDLGGYGVMAATAREFGISWPCLASVVARRTWKHVK